MKNRNSGFSLLEIMIVVGAIAGLSLVVMQITKNTANTQTSAFNMADYLGLRSQIDSMIANELDCQANFKGFSFKASLFKNNPQEVELWHGDQRGEKSRKFLSTSDPSFKKFGKLSISSIQISMPDYTDKNDFPEGTDQMFKMNLQVLGDKQSNGKQSLFNPINKQVNIVFNTNAHGESTITNCGGIISGLIGLNSPPEMGDSTYCILANKCPAGWIDNGSAGITAKFTESNKSKCTELFEPGSDYNSSWGWCHPRLCCNH